MVTAVPEMFTPLAYSVIYEFIIQYIFLMENGILHENPTLARYI